MGQVVRLVLLVTMVAYAYRKIDLAAAGVLAAEAAVIGTLAVVAW